MKKIVALLLLVCAMIVCVGCGGIKVSNDTYNTSDVLGDVYK